MMLEDIYYIVQIISSVFVISGVVIALRQYILSIKNTEIVCKQELELKNKEIYQREKEKIVRAIDLAGYYKDNILSLAKKLKKIYIDTGIFKIIQNIEMDNMRNFDIIELEKNLTNDQIEQIKVLGNKYHVDTALKEESIAYNLEEDYNKGESTNNSSGGSKEQIAIDYAKIVVETLNNLEYFSMYFVHNTADHTVVYQSLHMTFLEVVKILYYDISSVNKNGERKFFINIITLFNKWNKIAEEQQGIEINTMRELVHIGKILKENEQFEEI
ncbi:MAG: hypothetical protein NC300_11390 [Bacteroidales bacterium]|nr:hypothetical protein [Clostridium sp.]MCM1204735.1 hypothetical protein [Bacteroidales bacterium]